MTIRAEKSIYADLGNGITAKLTRDENRHDWYLQILWANNEEALEYDIEISQEAMSSFIKMFTTAIYDLEESN